jgi:hypothetical protein
MNGIPAQNDVSKMTEFEQIDQQELNGNIGGELRSCRLNSILKDAWLRHGIVT